LMGVVVAFITYIGKEVLEKGSDWSIMKAVGLDAWHYGTSGPLFGFLTADVLGVIMFAALLYYLYWDSKRAKVE